MLMHHTTVEIVITYRKKRASFADCSSSPPLIMDRLSYIHERICYLSDVGNKVDNGKEQEEYGTVISYKL